MSSIVPPSTACHWVPPHVDPPAVTSLPSLPQSRAGALSMAVTVASNTAGEASFGMNFIILFSIMFTGGAGR